MMYIAVFCAIDMKCLSKSSYIWTSNSCVFSESSPNKVNWHIRKRFKSNDYSITCDVNVPNERYAWRELIIERLARWPLIVYIWWFVGCSVFVRTSHRHNDKLKPHKRAAKQFQFEIRTEWHVVPLDFVTT